MKKIIALLIGLLIAVTPALAEEVVQEDTVIDTPDVEEISEEELTEDAGVTPDSWMYGFERRYEKLQLALTFGEEKKARLRYEFTKERLAEAHVMAKKNKPELAKKAAEDYQTELDETNEEVERAVAKGKDVSDLVERVAARRARHLAVLQRVYDKVPEQAKEAIGNVIERAEARNIEIAKRFEARKNGEEEATDKPEKEVKEKPEREAEEEEEIEEEEVEEEEIEEEEVEEEDSGEGKGAGKQGEE